MTSLNKPNTGFWIIAVLALLWNLMGAFQFIGSAFMEEAYKEMATPEQIVLLEALPSWYDIVFAVATLGGLLASLMMLLRKRMAVTLFLISLIAVLVQMGYWLFATDVMEVEGAQSAIMPLIVITVSIFLYFYNKGAAQKGWLK